MFGAIIGLTILFIAAWFLFDAYRLYVESGSTGLQRLWDAGKGSATILWQRFVVVVTAAVGGLASIADYLGDPSISQAIQTYMKPEYVAGVMVLIALVTVWARKRTL